MGVGGFQSGSGQRAEIIETCPRLLGVSGVVGSFVDLQRLFWLVLVLLVIFALRVACGWCSFPSFGGWTQARQRSRGLAVLLRPCLKARAEHKQ